MSLHQLLETHKPFITGALLQSGPHALLLLASRIDTSADCTLLLLDRWLLFRLVGPTAVGAGALLLLLHRLRRALAGLLGRLLEETNSSRASVLAPVPKGYSHIYTTDFLGLFHLMPIHLYMFSDVLLPRAIATIRRESVSEKVNAKYTSHDLFRLEKHLDSTKRCSSELIHNEQVNMSSQNHINFVSLNTFLLQLF